VGSVWGDVPPPISIEDEFKLTVLDIPMLSLADLYGGKIVAALDRQLSQIRVRTTHFSTCLTSDQIF
jgi:hypothetical protein